jgi:uncharacterized protein YkwD
MKKLINFIKSLFNKKSELVYSYTKRTNSQIEIELLDLINVYRIGLDLQILNPNELINDISYRNTQRMLSSGFNHNGAVERFNEVRKVFNSIYEAEILAKDFTTAKSVLNGWIKSDSHNKQMTKPNINQVGISFENKIISVIFAEIN